MMDHWRRLLVDSLTRPRTAARRVTEWTASTQTVLGIGALTVIVSVLLSGAAYRPSPAAADLPVARLLRDPLLFAVLQMAVVVAMAKIVHVVGRVLGGTGGFAASLALIVWFQVVSTILQIAQVAMLALLPPLGLVVILFSFVWFFWALSAFVAELHGFDSQAKVFGGILVALVVIAVLIVLGANLTGMTPPGTA